MSIRPSYYFTHAYEDLKNQLPLMSPGDAHVTAELLQTMHQAPKFWLPHNGLCFDVKMDRSKYVSAFMNVEVNNADSPMIMPFPSIVLEYTADSSGVTAPPETPLDKLPEERSASCPKRILHVMHGPARWFRDSFRYQFDERGALKNNFKMLTHKHDIHEFDVGMNWRDHGALLVQGLFYMEDVGLWSLSPVQAIMDLAPGFFDVSYTNANAGIQKAPEFYPEIILNGMYEGMERTRRRAMMKKYGTRLTDRGGGGGLITNMDAVRHMEEEMMPPIFNSLCSDIGEELITVIDFLLMMNSTNRVFDKITPSAKLNKKRAKNGKVPLYEYSVVDIDFGDKKRGNVAQGGTHASPRYHLRSAHLRILPSGKLTAVRATTVGDRKRGVVEHDYRVKT